MTEIGSPNGEPFFVFIVSKIYDYSMKTKYEIIFSKKSC